jgi:hypothetical protein
MTAVENKNIPSPTTKIDIAVGISELEIMQQVFAEVEKDAAEIAEELFEYLFEVDDVFVVEGEIPLPKNKKLRNYILALNKLFKLARREPKFGSYRIINRRVVKELDKRTYMFCMCVDGGTSLDVLCEIVNQENSSRTPTNSPVKITVRQFAPQHNIGSH